MPTSPFSSRVSSFLSQFLAKARPRRYVVTRIVEAAADTVAVEAVAEATEVVVAVEVTTTTAVDEAATTTTATTTTATTTTAATLTPRATAPLPTPHLLSSLVPTPGRHLRKAAFHRHPQAGFLLHKQPDGKVQEAMAARLPSRSAPDG
jgi:hypothetical protein